jgi:AraC-like DNA-binding protein
MVNDQIRFDEPRSGVQRLAARFGGHAYDTHRHETYGVGLTLWGAQSFHYRGTLRTSRGGQVMVLHPDEAHDGHATVDAGFAYRMLYVDPAAVSLAIGGFPQSLEPLAVDAVVERLAGRLAARSDDRPRAPGTTVAHRAVARARDFLAAESHRTVASEELETVTGLDRFALSRHFRAATGTSPHRYQVGRRLARAQKMIAEGAGLSDAAAATGFADQSHLTRHFSARFGLTPGRWATLARQS